MSTAEEQKVPVQAAAATEESKVEEEKKGEEDTGPIVPKHVEIAETVGESAELIENRHTRNITSHFINQRKSWDDENDFQINADLVRGITQELGFIKPSKIQAVAIPLISMPVDNVY